MKYRLLPEEEDRRKLLLISKCFGRLPDKWASSAIVYICAKMGVKFNRYWSEGFGFLPDQQIIWENQLMGDLNCLILDRIISKSRTPGSLILKESPYISSILKKSEKTFSRDYATMKEIKKTLAKHKIPIRKSDLYLLSQFLRGLEASKLTQLASQMGISQEDLRHYKDAALHLSNLQKKPV